MGFGPVFGRAFPATFDRAVSAAAAAWWYVAGKTCVAAYQPKGAASLAASYVNLAQPGTYDAAPGVAPSWATATGWTFDGLSQYLLTGVIPAQNWTLIVRFSNATAGVKLVAGCLGAGSSRFWVWPSTGVVRSYGHGGELIPLSGISNGVMAIAGPTGYYNGAPDGAIPAGNYNFIAVYVGCINNAGSPAFYLAVNVQAVALYSSALSGAQVATLSAAMAAL